MGFFTRKKEESNEVQPNAIDTLATKWGVPQYTRLEWSPIIDTLSKAHKQPVQVTEWESSPKYKCFMSTQINGFHGTPKPSQHFLIGELMQYNPILKTIMSGTIGYGLGCAFGLFMYSTRTNAIEAQYSQAAGAGPSLAHQNWRGWRVELGDMGKDMHRSGKNFGFIGGAFIFTESMISIYRGKEDMTNPVLAGFLIGAAGGLRAGVGPAAMGGAGFAIFSYAIEQFMGRYG